MFLQSAMFFHQIVTQVAPLFVDWMVSGGVFMCISKKKHPIIFILFNVCKVVCPAFIFKGEIFVAQGSDSFTSFWGDDFFIIRVLLVCSRKLKRWRGILQGNRKCFLPRGTQLVEAETLSLDILWLWPGLQLTDSISSLRDPGWGSTWFLRHSRWASTLVLERPRVDRTYM